MRRLEKWGQGKSGMKCGHRCRWRDNRKPGSQPVHDEEDGGRKGRGWIERPVQSTRRVPHTYACSVRKLRSADNVFMSCDHTRVLVFTSCDVEGQAQRLV